jgi:cytochrome c
MSHPAPQAPTGWGALIVVVIGVSVSLGLEAQVLRSQALQAPSPDPALAAKGKAVYEAKCSGCHSVEAHRVGPMHAGVVGRIAGKAPGYTYSPALSASQLAWTPESLMRWLLDPETVIPGQRMGYSLGIREEREAVIAYLQTLKAP